MKIKLGILKRIIKEEAIAPAGGGSSLSKLLDDVTQQFAHKMKAQYPGADDLVQQEANELKMQITAQIKASAAKVKMSVGKVS